MRDFKVWAFRPAREARGKKKVRVKWVQDERLEGEVRARLVCMEFATDQRGDTFAGTPGLVVVRYIVSRVATRGLGKLQGIRQLAVHDVSCAFLHADADEEIYLVFPSHFCSPVYGGLLL